MAKVITVWGNPDCGKSMFRYVLTKVLTVGKQRAIIINADPTAPMLLIWMSGRILEQDASVGGVLSSLDINSTLVAERVAVLKGYPFIGVMGYAAGEIPFSYPELKYDRIKLLISEASRLVNYIILDCSSSVINFFTPTTIESTDMIVQTPTPDLKGISYLKARKPLLTDAKSCYDEHLTFVGLTRSFHALDETGRLAGGFDGILPYAEEIERCGTSGGMFRALAYCNQCCINSMKLVRQRLEIRKASQKTDTAQEEEILNEWPKRIVL